MDPMIMRGRIEITGSSSIPGCVSLLYFRPVGSVEPNATRPNEHPNGQDSIKISIQRDQRFRQPRRDGFAHCVRRYGHRGKEWGAVGVPAKARILRQIYYDSREGVA